MPGHVMPCQCLVCLVPGAWICRSRMLCMPCLSGLSVQLCHGRGKVSVDRYSGGWMDTRGSLCLSSLSYPDRTCLSGWFTSGSFLTPSAVAYMAAYTHVREHGKVTSGGEDSDWTGHGRTWQDRAEYGESTKNMGRDEMKQAGTHHSMLLVYAVSSSRLGINHMVRLSWRTFAQVAMRVGVSNAAWTSELEDSPGQFVCLPKNPGRTGQQQRQSTISDRRMTALGVADPDRRFLFQRF